MPIPFRNLVLILLSMPVMSFRMEVPGTTTDYAALGPVPGPGPDISIIIDDTAGVSTLHGLEKLTASLTSRHIDYEKITDPRQARGKYLMVAGLAYGNGTAATLLKAAGHPVMRVAEALTVWHTSWRQKPAIVIAGYDDTGLMYALLETARQIGFARDAQAAVHGQVQRSRSPASAGRQTGSCPSCPRRPGPGRG